MKWLAVIALLALTGCSYFFPPDQRARQAAYYAEQDRQIEERRRAWTRDVSDADRLEWGFAVLGGRIKIGMPPDAIRASIGPPSTVDVTRTGGGATTWWNYSRPYLGFMHRYRSIAIEEGYVTAIFDEDAGSKSPGRIRRAIR